MDTHDSKPETNASGFIAPTSNAVEPEFELSTVPGHEGTAPIPEEAAIADSVPEEAAIADSIPEEAAIADSIPEEAAIADSVPLDPKPKKSRTPFQESLRRFRRDKRAMASLIMILAIVVIAIFGPAIYHHIGGPYKQQLGTHIIGPDVYHTFDHQELDRAHEMPSAQYWLGTDGIGRDILARLMQGMLISIVLAVVVEIVDISLGVTVGVLAGYYGGWIDQLLARLADLLFAFPGLLFIILVAGILGGWADDNLGAIPVIGAGGNARLLLISIVLAFTSWPLMARYVRGQALQIKEQQFIEAARTAGTSDFTILTRHIVPNLFSIVMVASTLNIAGTIIGEAGISYLGLGVRPPGASIGLMISDASQSLSAYPWELLVPSLTLVIIVLSFSFIGDGLRDAFDPHSKD